MVLFAGVALKPEPLIVTDVLTGPEDGEKELIFGCALALILAIEKIKSNRVG